MLIFSPLVGMLAMALDVLASQIRTDLSPDAVAWNSKINWFFQDLKIQFQQQFLIANKTFVVAKECN